MNTVDLIILIVIGLMVVVYVGVNLAEAGRKINEILNEGEPKE